MIFTRLLRQRAAVPFAACGLALLSAAAWADAATATIAPTPIQGRRYHYDLTLTNTGTTPLGSFWFAWVPGQFYLTSTPADLTAPAGWSSSAPTGPGGASVLWTAATPLAPGATLAGFSFDSSLTPDQITGPSPGGAAVDTSFVYAGAPLSDAGAKLVPSLVQPLPPIAAATSILPGGRSVVYGTPATVFASFVNTSATDLSGCGIALPGNAPRGLTMSYQPTDPATNALTGKANTPVPIANYAAQSFLLSFSADSTVSAPGLAPVFSCSGTQPVPVIPGVNTVDLSFANVPVADVIAIAATASQDGIIHAPQGKGGAFAVATVNAGTGDTITVSADTGTATLPLAIEMCATDSGSGACLAPPAPSVTLNFAASATPTFSVFVAASAPIALDPANARIFVRYKDAAGGPHGSTSVAVETQ